MLVDERLCLPEKSFKHLHYIMLNFTHKIMTYKIVSIAGANNAPTVLIILCIMTPLFLTPPIRLC